MLEIVSTLQFDPVQLTDKHKKQSSWKVNAICLIDGDIDMYYSWFLKKRFNLELNRPIRKAHITVISDKITDATKYAQAKELFDGKTVVFTYDPSDIRTNGEHFWIIVNNTDIDTIRDVAGLERKAFFGMHLTLGYTNEKNRMHGDYVHRTMIRYRV